MTRYGTYIERTSLLRQDRPSAKGIAAIRSLLRADNRRVSNGDRVNRITALALKPGKSVDFTGYWQRHAQSA
jgi:hypothetical protein